MDQIQRIKSEGWLPDSFWQAETLCDYPVSTLAKEVWAIELDIHRQFDLLCRRHNLRYCAAGGTLLGIIRHQGFIPWDDDIDLYMPRNDYNRLKTIAHELPEPYFLQSPDTDPEYGYSFIKIRNSLTTCLIEKFRYTPFNHGIHIDIFPLDTVDPSDYLLQRADIFELIMASSARMKHSHPNLVPRDLEQIDRYYNPQWSSSDIFHQIETLCMRHYGHNTGYISNLTFHGYPAERLIYPAYLFDTYDESALCGVPMRLPHHWHEVLSISFGDYMTFPPVEQRGAWHQSHFDPHTPYQQLLQQS